MITTRIAALGGTLLGASAIATVWVTSSATVLPVVAGAAILVTRLSGPHEDHR